MAHQIQGRLFLSRALLNVSRNCCLKDVVQFLMIDCEREMDGNTRRA